MAKTRLKEIAEKNNIEFDDALKLAQEKLPAEMINTEEILGKTYW